MSCFGNMWHPIRSTASAPSIQLFAMHNLNNVHANIFSSIITLIFLYYLYQNNTKSLISYYFDQLDPLKWRWKEFYMNETHRRSRCFSFKLISEEFASEIASRADLFLFMWAGNVFCLLKAMREESPILSFRLDVSILGPEVREEGRREGGKEGGYGHIPKVYSDVSHVGDKEGDTGREREGFNKQKRERDSSHLATLCCDLMRKKSSDTQTQQHKHHPQKESAQACIEDTQSKISFFFKSTRARK